MPTVIDSLLVRLGLDSSNFEKGKKKVVAGVKDIGDKAEGAGKKIQKSNKKNADGFKDMAVSAAKFFGVIGTAVELKRYISDQIQANATLQRFSDNVGQNITAVASWSNLAEQAGGSAEGLRQTMSMLSQAQTQLHMEGTSQLIPFFSMLGVSMFSAEEPMQRLLHAVDNLKAKHLSRAENFNILTMYGHLDPGTANLMLDNTSQQLKELLKRQEDLNKGLEANGPASKQLQTDTAVMNQTFKAMGTYLYGDLIPGLDAFAKAATAAGNAIIKVHEAAEGKKSWTPNNVVTKAFLKATQSVGANWMNGPPRAPIASRSGDKDKFIAIAAAQLGISPQVLAAQLQLETPNGKTIGMYNYGNMKAGKDFKGNTVNKDVVEYINGLKVTESSKFQSYTTVEEAAKAYVEYIKRKFPKAVGAKSAKDYASALFAGGYATDPDYVNKVSKIANGKTGTSQFAAASPSALPSNTANSNSTTNIQNTVGDIHIHAHGDTDGKKIFGDMQNQAPWLFVSQANAGLR